MKVLGEGAYAQVVSDGDTAIKIIPNENIENAIREIGFVRACNHPNVIKINKISMDLVKTELHMRKYPTDLHKYMKQHMRLPIETVFAISRSIVEGMSYVHKKGIIHGDIKPENILLDMSGIHPAPIICDFGISIAYNEKFHRGRLQTCTYRAPEVDYYDMRAQYSQSIDMWSVGCILFELAAGYPAVNYADGIEDSSWYACKFLELYCGGDRRERLKLLRSVNLPFIRKMIVKKLSHESVRRELLINIGFVELIARCLHPNPKKRVDADSVLQYFDCKFGFLPERLPVKAIEIPSEISIDDMYCLINIDIDVIGACNEYCLQLAESLYTKYMNLTGPYVIGGDGIRYACMFIASCMLPSYYHIPTMIMQRCDKRKIYKDVSKIVTKLRGRVI